MYNSYLNDNFYHQQFKDVDGFTIENSDNPNDYKQNENSDTSNNYIPSENSDASNNYIPKDNPDIPNDHDKKQDSIFSGMFNNLAFPEITSETLILFAIIFFSIYDELDLDLLIIIGVLFLIGI